MTAVNVKRTCALHRPAGVKRSAVAEHWYCDRVDVTKFSYLWKIEKFSSFQGKATSPVFASNDCSKIKWQIVISESEGVVILLLKLVSSDQSRVKFKFKGTILNAGGEADHSIGKWNGIGSSYGAFMFPRRIDIEELQKISRGLLVNDTLSLVCDITVIIDVIDSTPRDIGAGDTLESPIHEGMAKLLETGKFSDVTLIVEGKRYQVHKAILSLRSEVFAAMFDHEMMEENTTNQIAINDFDHHVIREMLTFIYSNKSPNIDEMAGELLAAADKYAVTYLKIMCESVLDRDISIETALPTLVLADRHSAYTLKARSIHFIKANISDIMETDEWQTMVNKYSHLIDEIESYNGCIDNGMF